MSASDIQIVTIIVPNPQYGSAKTAKIISPSLGFGARINNAFQTLSNNNPNNIDAIEGLLYLPTLPSSDTNVCAEADTVIPTNATRLANFPADQKYPLVAIFPWTSSADCTRAYFAQARADAVRASIVFQSNNSQTPSTGVPSANDPSWMLGDRSQWKADNQFPIYALTASQGLQLMSQMSLYSGNMSEAPNGATLVQEYDSRDYPRLFAHVGLQGGTNVPSLWIFLIIVLAVLLGIVIIASIVMHIIQRHQRRVLQRRLERGEVDLEILGIKKMNVPQEKIDEMPRYTFTEAVEAPVAAAVAKKLGAPSSIEPHAASFSQSTCAICLDDFVAGESDVRELPCKHIYHPECIDIFLRDTSSLCPMCKKSALPAGYCPVKVTNLMVRRERLVRRMRERRRQGMAAAAARTAGVQPTAATQSSWLRRHMHGPSASPSGPALPPAPPVVDADRTQTDGTNENNTDVELGQIGSAEQPPQSSTPHATTVPIISTRRHTMALPVDVAEQGPAARRAWRRERLARQQDEQYNQEAESARQADVGRPLWRRVVGRIAPGID